MEAETLKMRTGVKREVMATADDDMKDSAALSNKVNGGGGNDEVSQRPHDPAVLSYITGGWTYPYYEKISQQPPESDHVNEEKEEKSSPPLPPPIYSIDPSNSFVISPNGPIGITISPTQEVKEIYLKKMFVMPPNHQFYCPNCKVSIDKVLFCHTDTQRPGKFDPLPPIPIPPIPTPTPDPIPNPTPDQVRCSECFGYLIQRGKDFITELASCFPGHRSIVIPEDEDPRPAEPERRDDSKGWEILKSVVYGGLAELLASLSVVTSAASADATTLNIFALGIANLIGGLFVLAHNLRDLKASQPREEGGETDTAVDKYYELLGQRENHLLHAFVAILSFLIFGLVPPIVYGFSFRESDDKDFKLGAVAIASLICITLLATAKAYIQRSNNYMTYLKTISFYVSSGVLATLLTYEAGTLVNRFIQQLGWFEPAKSNSALFNNNPQMSIEKPRWGSF